MRGNDIREYNIVLMECISGCSSVVDVSRAAYTRTRLPSLTLRSCVEREPTRTDGDTEADWSSIPTLYQANALRNEQNIIPGARFRATCSDVLEEMSGLHGTRLTSAQQGLGCIALNKRHPFPSCPCDSVTTVNRRIRARVQSRHPGPILCIFRRTAARDRIKRGERAFHQPFHQVT